MARSQQETLRSDSCPLGGHAALFMHRGPEIGRLSACVQTNHDYDDQNSFQQQISQNPSVGWMRDIPPPYQLKMKIILAIADQQD